MNVVLHVMADGHDMMPSTSLPSLFIAIVLVLVWVFVNVNLFLVTFYQDEEEESLLTGESIFGHTFQVVRRGVTGKKCDMCNKALLPLLKKSFQCACKCTAL